MGNPSSSSDVSRRSKKQIIRCASSHPLRSSVVVDRGSSVVQLRVTKGGLLEGVSSPTGKGNGRWLRPLPTNKIRSYTRACTGRRISPCLVSTELGVGWPVSATESRTRATERAASCDPDKPQKSHDTTHVTAISHIWPDLARFRRLSEKWLGVACTAVGAG